VKKTSSGFVRKPRIATATGARDDVNHPPLFPIAFAIRIAPPAAWQSTKHPKKEKTR